MIENMVVEIESFHSEVVRKRASFFKITEGMEHEDVALIGLRVALHSLIVGNQTVVTVGSKIGRAISQKRTDSSDGVYYYKTAESEKENGAGGIKVLDLVLKSLPKGIMGYRLISETVNGKRKSTYTITQGTKFEEFMREHDDIFGMGASNKMPMVCLPDSWDSVYGGGFLSKKAKESCPLVKRLPKHDKPQGDTIFNSINHLQKTGYRVNQQMFSVYRELDKLKPL
ncbi:MAG: hypothetical protein HRT61_25065, partial [Ekhidna sp.]|nr:hypothetical protein [Ekhidna sp.]